MARSGMARAHLARDRIANEPMQFGNIDPLTNLNFPRKLVKPGKAMSSCVYGVAFFARTR